MKNTQNYPTESFIKTPKKGQIIKVFTNTDKFLCFAVAKGVKFNLKERLVEVPNKVTIECTEKIKNIRKKISTKLKSITPIGSSEEEKSIIIKEYYKTKECKKLLSEMAKIKEIKDKNRVTVKEKYLREVVEVEKTNINFDINDVSFFLNKSKVHFLN